MAIAEKRQGSKSRAGDWQKRTKTRIYPPHCEWIDVGFSGIEISKWSTDYQRFPFVGQRVLADTVLAIPALTQLCRARIGAQPALKEKIEKRRAKVAAKHRALREKWRRDALTAPRLVSEVWDAIKDEDGVLTANTLNDWARKLWNFDRGHRHPGKPALIDTITRRPK